MLEQAQVRWLCDLLASAGGYIDLSKPEDRQLLAEAILEEIPRQLVADTIRDSARAVLRTHGIENGELAREIGNNAAHSALAQLQVDGGDAESPVATIEPLPEVVNCGTCIAMIHRDFLPGVWVMLDGVWFCPQCRKPRATA